MSTRCNIIVKDKYDEELVFYRHSDGYPDGALPTLNKFLDYVKEGKIRDNVGQAAGWLILLGADEYRDFGEYISSEGYKPKEDICEPTGGVRGWKCGAIEPSISLHGDIEFLYVIDLSEKVIYIDGVDGYTYNGKFGSFADATKY